MSGSGMAPSRRSIAYRFRPVSFMASISLHGAVILGLGLIPSYQDEPSASKRPIYDELIRPSERRIVWYNYRQPLPDVTAAKRVGTFPKPRGLEPSKQAIIATSPHAKSSKQIIWRPVPKIEIKQDLPAPNVVLRSATSIPLPAPPPREYRKFVQPNVEGVHAEQPNVSLLTPNGDVRFAPPSARALDMPMPREFVPPPPSDKPARLAVPVDVGDIARPDASVAGSTGARMALPEGLGAPSLSRGAPPPSNAPPGAEANAGNGRADIAVASLTPGTGPVPDGARAGAFSKAPNLGEPASGDVKGGLNVPNLTIREDRSKPVDAPHVSANRKVVMYADKVRTLPASTLSVPLRPASRTIPRAIDARFPGRNVYTMVIPIENFAPYSGDWILWFAERGPTSGDTPLVRAPLPLRKFESVDPVLPGAHTELRVQVTCTINYEGKIVDVKVLRSVSPGVEQAVMRDLAEWEFKPATRDRAPIDVDAVIEIPYSLPPQIAKRTGP